MGEQRHTPDAIDKLVPLDLREKIDAALRDMPPEYATYQAVHEGFHLLEDYGIEHGVVERRGRRLREEKARAQRARLANAREMAEAIAGSADPAQLTKAAELLMFGDFFEYLQGEERDPKTTREFVGGMRDLVKAQVDREADRRAAEAEHREKEKHEQDMARRAAEFERIVGKEDGPRALTPDVLEEIRSKVLGL